MKKKQVRQLAGAPFELAPPWNVAFVGCAGPLLHRVLDIWDVHKPHLTALGVDPAIADATQSARLICCVNQRLFAGPEAYRITVAADRISMVGSSINFNQLDHSLQEQYAHFWVPFFPPREPYWQFHLVPTKILFFKLVDKLFYFLLISIEVHTPPRRFLPL